MLGNHQEISEKTAMLFLNILENRVGELFGYRSGERASRAGGLISGRGTPRSPRYSKTVSELSMAMSSATGGTVAANSSGGRPVIVLDKTFSGSADGSEDDGGIDEEQDEMLETEVNPLGYLSMRVKVIDSASSVRSGSRSDNESVVSNIVIAPVAQ